ncbi:hypothetical protein HUK80_15785 [Flavobacterium sp. MAH-1]|uniref:Uncharacterized protein n=1 Tax=Flavobacterium agri TaxID=2743471 RepID=A0A7Y9C6R5_9FLAO|nr:hypothetical protein [Flavobacterium agri]NUY82366.1 hypothetical protein [Flavobacterium agri]NYA72390.1 hypothetical protein [Flavobacterium agri]
MAKYLLLLLLVCSCADKVAHNPHPLSKTAKDTIIDLEKTATGFGHAIDTAVAKNVLYKHFRNKGELIEAELDIATFDAESPENLGKKAIAFLKLYGNKLNGKNQYLIDYYHCEPFANGNCVRAHFAVISETKDGFEIVNEDCIPSTFNIDSIVNYHDKTSFFAHDYECANQKRKASYRIHFR